MNARAKIRKFTLIEMIVVLIIVGTMIGMSVGVVSILKTKETPKAGYRILTQMIYGSRSYALTKRSYVAIVLPTSSKLSDAQVAKQFATNENGNYAIAIRPFTISRDLQTLTPIKGSGWQYLPKGVYLDLTSTTNLEELSTVTIGGVTNQTCDAIIFRQTGGLNTLSDVENLVVTTEDGKTSYDVTINGLTGKPSIPEAYKND